MLHKTSWSVFLGAALLASACGTLEVPFLPVDGLGGDTGSGGTTTGSTGGASGGNPAGGAGPSGGGSTGGFVTIDGGAPSFGGGGAFSTDADLIVSGDSEITGIDVTDTHVYWVEYGTYDALKNYRFDGVLRGIALDGGEIETIAEDLEGPVQLQTSTSAGYVGLDQSTTIDPDGDYAFVQVSLTDGALDVLMEDNYAYISTFEDRAYVPIDSGDEWSLFEFAPGQAPRKLRSGYLSTFAADATHLYFWGASDELWRQPLDGDEDAAERLSTTEREGLALHGDRVLATNTKGSDHIAAISKEGGAWTNVIALGRDNCGIYAIRGERYFVYCSQNTSYYLTGLIESGEPETVLTFQSGDYPPVAFAESAIYFAHGKYLYRQGIE